MKAHSFYCQSPSQLKSQVLFQQRNHFQPKLAIVFCSISQDIDAIRSIFNELEMDVIGCTTAGEIVDANLYEKSIAVMLLSIDAKYYKILASIYEGGNVPQAALQLGQNAVDTFKNPGLILMSGGLTVDAELIVENILSGAGKDLPMFGGLAGDDLKMESTFVFNNTAVSPQGLLALVIDTDHIALQGLAISGWEAVGGINTITKSKGNIIYTINNERAYDVFIRYFGLSNNDPLISIQTNYPLQLMKEEGDAVLRSPIVISEDDGSITLAAGVKKGDQFRFSSSPGFEVIDTTIAKFESYKEEVSGADALLQFSCKGRHGAFGPMLEDEIEGIYKQWGKPMIGFLSYGEFGNSGKGKCEFHNETCSLVILKEK